MHTLDDELESTFRNNLFIKIGRKLLPGPFHFEEVTVSYDDKLKGLEAFVLNLQVFFVGTIF